MWNYSFVFTRFFRRYKLDNTNTSAESLFENEKDIRKMFSIIEKSFQKVTVMVETMSPFVVKHMKELMPVYCVIGKIPRFGISQIKK